MSKKSRRKVVVNPKKFATYALAGAAAAVGAETLDADITPGVDNVGFVLQDTTVDGSSADVTLYFGDASSAFLDITHSLTAPTSGTLLAGGQLLSFNATGVSVAGMMIATNTSTASPGFNSYVSNVASGAAISGLTNWLSVSGTLADGAGFANSQFAFSVSGTGFLAVRWDDDGPGGVSGPFSYGWIRVAVSGVNLNALQILSYAWADQGEALNVNQSVPEPGSLAGLALGAVGLISWRRRRRNAA